MFHLSDNKISGIYNDIYALKTYITAYILVLVFSTPYAINMFAFIPEILVVYKLATNLYYSSLKKTFKGGCYLFTFDLLANVYICFLTQPDYLIRFPVRIIFTLCIISGIESFLATLLLYLYYTTVFTPPRKTHKILYNN